MLAGLLRQGWSSGHTGSHIVLSRYGRNASQKVNRTAISGILRYTEGNKARQHARSMRV